MSKCQKSKKDIAFEKERTKFRSEIRKLKDELRAKDKQISELEMCIIEKEDEIRCKQDWIERLLAYTELSEEDMRKRIKEEQEHDEIQNIVLDISRPFLNCLGGIIHSMK